MDAPDYGPTKATIDARAGGQYRFELTHGADEMSVIVGEYLEVVAPERLVYIFEADSMDEALSLAKNHPHLNMPGGCEIEVREARAVPGM